MFPEDSERTGHNGQIPYRLWVTVRTRDRPNRDSLSRALSCGPKRAESWNSIALCRKRNPSMTMRSRTCERLGCGWEIGCQAERRGSSPIICETRGRGSPDSLAIGVPKAQEVRPTPLAASAARIGKLSGPPDYQVLPTNLTLTQAGQGLGTRGQGTGGRGQEKSPAAAPAGDTPGCGTVSRPALPWLRRWEKVSS